MMSRQNITQYTDRELALIVYNHPFWYHSRFSSELIQMINDAFIYRPCQLDHLKQTLKEEQDEVND